MNDSQLLAKVIKCVDFAARKHADLTQFYRDFTPDINHPIGVAHILSDEGDVSDPDVILAAILHDSVEDAGASFEEIEELFGSKVSKIVKEVTDDKSLSEEERKRLQIERAPIISTEAKLVQLADKLYNLRERLVGDPFSWNPEGLHQYFVWAQNVVAGLRGVNQKLEDKLDMIFGEYFEMKRQRDLPDFYYF